MRASISTALRAATRRSQQQQRTLQSRLVSTQHETARSVAIASAALPLVVRTCNPARSLALLSLAALATAATATATATVAFAAPSIKTMESADAVKAEELYNNNAYDRRTLLVNLREMHTANPSDVGVTWRLARAAYDVANLKSTPTDEKKELIYYARDVIQRGLDATQDVAQVHNWFGIILSSIGDYEGSKASIANSVVIKQHWETSSRLDPTNATTFHLLGRWCISIADLSWLERKAAAVLFGTPPESSYDEALAFLLQSESLAPGTWKKNTLLIAQVYYKKKDWAAAKTWTEKAIAVPVVTEEDQTCHDEATALLKKL